MKLGDFMNSLSSVEAVPGGGSAGAIGGAIGASLILMALKISFKKIDLTEEAETLINNLEKEKTYLEGLADADSEAYSSVMKAFKMPKESEEEKSVRKEAIQHALKHAAEIPMQTAQSCFRVINMAFNAFNMCNSSCFSDAASGFQFAKTGFRCAMFNVDINLSSIKDEKFVKAMKAKKDDMFSVLSSCEIESEKIFAEKMC